MTNSAGTTVVYIVRCVDDSLYTGWTTNVERRVQEHNAGRGARYTASRRPVRLVFTEIQPDRRTAMRREQQIKRMSRVKKLELVASHIQEG
jgi:putative endonuclease